MFETVREAAIREVYEESGYDISGMIDDNTETISKTISNAKVTLFIIPNFSLDTPRRVPKRDDPMEYVSAFSCWQASHALSKVLF